VRLVVVEDEEVAAGRLIRLTEKILGPGQFSVTHKTTLEDALEHLEHHIVDLLFLDLNLDGRDGFRLLSLAAAGAFQTIIVSAQHDQALRAFEYGVTDFVAKPYDENRLRQAIQRVTSREDFLKGRLRYLAVRKGAEILPIAVADVVFAQGADDYTEIHCGDGSKPLHNKTLSALEHLLPAQFQRVHRS